MANENLSQAKSAKNDEFYTQWADIEREVQLKAKILIEVMFVQC